MNPTLLHRLIQKNGLQAPLWLADGASYLGLSGSFAYGCNEPGSDRDIVGFAVPPQPIVFPWLAGHVPGFGTTPPRFDQWQQAHLADENGQEVDISVYGIVRYFDLCYDNNPNMLDSLFVPEDCVLYSNAVGRMVRDRRKLFLSKRCLVTYRGYATSQIKKLEAKRPQEGSRRFEDVQRWGFDTKYATHLLRLTAQCIQVLTEGDMDLRRDSEVLKAVRRGEFSRQEVMDWHARKDAELGRIAEGVVAVPDLPDEDAIKTLLLECLEHHYGSLQNCVVSEHKAVQALREIRAITERVL